MDERYVEAELQGGPEIGMPEDPDPADRIVASLTAPRRAFDGLLRARNLNGVIGIAAVVLVVLAVATNVITGSSDLFKVQQQERMERMIEQMEETEGVSDEDIEDMREGFNPDSSVGMIGMIIGSVITVPLILLILGLIILAVAKVFESGSETYIRYRHALAVAALSLIPMYVLSLLLATIQLVAGVDATRIGLHALVPTDMVVLHVALMAFTLPLIAWFVVAGIGTASIARSGETAPIITFAGITVAFMAIMGVLASIFPMMSPV